MAQNVFVGSIEPYLDPYFEPINTIMPRWHIIHAPYLLLIPAGMLNSAILLLSLLIVKWSNCQILKNIQPSIKLDEKWM